MSTLLIPISPFDGERRLRQAYQPSTPQRLGASASATIPSDWAWVDVAQRKVREILGPKRTLLQGVYAHANTPRELHLYVMDKVEEYDRDLSTALSKLEVVLTQALHGSFDDVQVHSVPFAGLEEVEVRHLRSGINLL